MGFLSKTWKSVKKVAKPLTYLNPLTYIGPGSDKKALAAYAGAAGLAGGAATIYGGLTGAGGAGSSAAALGKGGAAPIGVDPALATAGIGSTLWNAGSAAAGGIGSLLNSAGGANSLLSMGASGLAGKYAADAQTDINDKQLAWAREQSAIQQNASATQYQRAMADMKKAGLNPMLAYQQGGAAMPGTVQAPVLGNPVSQGVNSAAQFQGAQNQTEQTAANVQQIKQNVRLLGSKEGLTDAQIVQVERGITKLEMDIMQVEANTQITRNQIIESDVITQLIADNPWLSEMKYAGEAGAASARIIKEMFGSKAAKAIFDASKRKFRRY